MPGRVAADDNVRYFRPCGLLPINYSYTAEALLHDPGSTPWCESEWETCDPRGACTQVQQLNLLKARERSGRGCAAACVSSQEVPHRLVGFRADGLALSSIVKLCATKSIVRVLDWLLFRATCTATLAANAPKVRSCTFSSFLSLHVELVS